MQTRQLTDSEKRVLAAGLAHMQPWSRDWVDQKPEPFRFKHFLLAFVMAGIGWLLIGIAVLGVVGLLGVFAV